MISIKSMSTSIKYTPELIYNDPILSRTSWKRATTGGNGAFSMHTPRLIGECVLALWPRMRAWQFAILSCFFYSMIYLYFLPRAKPGDLQFILAGCIMGAAAFAISGFIELRPIYFNKEANFFGKGERRGKANRKRAGSYTYLLSDIYALQVIRTWANGGNGGWFTYELNVIFKNSQRQDLIECYSLKSVRACGELIADFLEVPIYCKSD